MFLSSSSQNVPTIPAARCTFYCHYGQLQQHGSDLVVPFKNLINDAYCRDISIKSRSYLEMKRKKGEYIGAFAVYGYLKDEKDKNRLVIDEYAAGVVRDIFACQNL